MLGIPVFFSRKAARHCRRPRSGTRLHVEPLESRALLAVLTDVPIVGGVSDTQAKIWFRTDLESDVAVEYSTAADLTGSTSTPVLTTQDVNDFTGIVTLAELLPETRYYYRIRVDGVPQQVTNFPTWTTFATAGRDREFSFAVAADVQSGVNYPNLPAPVYAQIAADAPSFVMQIGDFDHRNPKTLSSMRTMHRDVRGPAMASGADFAEHISDAFPLFHMWDDHDYGKNDGDKLFAGRASALLAFQEYFPTPTLPNPTAGVWHSFSFAQADFFMLDLRSQRDPHSDPEGHDKSILDGDNIANGQKNWLQAGLLSSTAAWKFVITTVPFNPTVQKKDGWAEYDTERQEILDFITANHIHGVVLISADMHYGGGIDNGAISGLPEINVPHTNMLAHHSDTTSQPGTWSEGILSGEGKPGYTLIRVTPTEVILENKGVDGVVRQSLTLSDIPVRGFSWFQETSDGNVIQQAKPASVESGTATVPTSLKIAAFFIASGRADSSPSTRNARPAYSESISTPRIPSTPTASIILELASHFRRPFVHHRAPRNSRIADLQLATNDVNAGDVAIDSP